MQNVNIECVNAKCRGVFPIVGNVPVLINDATSIFSVEDFLRQRNTFFTPHHGKIVEFVKSRIPTITMNVSATQNFNTFARLLLESSSNPKVLILGGSILGEGMESLLSYHELELIETDVSFGPRTELICDAHDIPFVEAFFDGVVVQAVLEHVVDPYRCVDEIHRVLKRAALSSLGLPRLHGQFVFRPQHLLSVQPLRTLRGSDVPRRSVVSWCCRSPRCTRRSHFSLSAE
jgi:SAM-dependent methyltransferase